MGNIVTAIGMMSGTSMDGIDVALIKTDGENIVERGPGEFFAYDAVLRKLLIQALEDAKPLTDRNARPGILSRVEDEITNQHAACLKRFLEAQTLGSEDVDVLGFHGQTVIHKPDIGLTVQLGNGKRLAEQTGIETVFDLRANDMRYGGQGAPLIPIYHQALAMQVERSGPVVFVNIGGISNVSYVGERLIAFDCGPGNALIDQWVQKHVGISHDQGGMIAAEGKVDDDFVQQYLENPYFAKPLPKSLDRGDFAVPEAAELPVEVVARSLARVTAEGIVKASAHFPEQPDLWIICGGGRHNPHIMRDIEELCNRAGSRAISAEAAGFDGDMMEAEAWAYLAVRAKNGAPITFPGTTGVSKPVSGGEFALPNQVLT